MKKQYWITDQQMLMSTSGGLKVTNATEISQTKFYKLKNQQRKIAEDIERDGFSLAEDGTFYMKIKK